MLLYNNCEKLPFIPIRTKDGNYYPNKDKYMIGTYTHYEINKALSLGYKLIAIEWSVVFEPNYNNFVNITPKLYHLKQFSKNEFDKYFFKMMMNASYGKLAQTRVGDSLFMDDVEKAEQYLAKNYQIVKGHKTNYLYTK